MRISHLHAPDVQYVPYAHWAFPDDDYFEEGEPSYMMAMPLNRLKGAAAKARPVKDALLATFKDYTLQLPALVHNVATLKGGEQWINPKKNTINRALPPEPPTGYALFAENYRQMNPNLFVNVNVNININMIAHHPVDVLGSRPLY